MKSKNAVSDDSLNKSAGGWMTNEEIRGYLDGYTGEDNTDRLGQILRSLKNEAVNSRSTIANANTTISKLNSEKESSKKAGDDFISNLGI
jgi:hypothetical protein